MADKVIVGTGSYLPERVVTNDDIEAMVLDFDRERAGCSLDEWCRKQMGAVERRRVAPGEGTSDMATRAAECALDDAKMTAQDIDLIVLATITSDHRVPPTAALVIGTDAMSHYMDPQKFRAQTIFGDGAGAVVLRNGLDGGYGLKAYSTGSSGA